MASAVVIAGGSVGTAEAAIGISRGGPLTQTGPTFNPLAHLYSPKSGAPRPAIVLSVPDAANCKISRGGPLTPTKYGPSSDPLLVQILSHASRLEIEPSIEPAIEDTFDLTQLFAATICDGRTPDGFDPQTQFYIVKENGKYHYINREDFAALDPNSPRYKELLDMAPLANAGQETDAEWIRTARQQFTYGAMNVGGAIRSGTGIAEGILLLLKVGEFATKILAAFTPASQCITGALYLGSHHWVRNGVNDSMKMAEREKDIEGIRIANISKWNARLYAGVGLTQTSCGVIGMMSPATANLMHYSPVLSTSAASTAGTVTGIGLGAVYTARGAVVIGRAAHNLYYLNAYENQFSQNCRAPLTELANGDRVGEQVMHDTLDEAIDKIEQGRYTLLPSTSDPNRLEKIETAQFKRRFGSSIPQKKNFKTLEDKVKYLAAVEKGLYTQKLREKLALAIGIAMFLGGIAIIVACCLLNPAAALIVVLACNSFFLLMESIFFTNDYDKLFNWVRDWRYQYNEPEYITKLRWKVNPAPKPSDDEGSVDGESEADPASMASLRAKANSVASDSFDGYVGDNQDDYLHTEADDQSPRERLASVESV